MTESEWLASTDPAEMLQHLKYSTYEDSVYGGVTTQSRHPPLITDRQLRLWVEACRAATGMPEVYTGFDLNNPLGLQGAVHDWSTRPARSVPASTNAALIREIVGNPWRPAKLDEYKGWQRSKVQPRYIEQIRGLPSWLAFDSGAIPRAATAIYDRGEFSTSEMGILGDLCETAGCEDEGVLGHLRGKELCPECLGKRLVVMKSRKPLPRDPLPNFIGCVQCSTGWLPLRGPHCRGCWAIQLLIGNH